VPSILQPVDPNEQFKLRRIEARRRRRKRRLVVAGLLLALITSGVAGAVLATQIEGHQGQERASATARPKAKAKALQPRPLPVEVRGVHVTMALASIPGKLDEYIRLKSEGLNTIELDVKDENGEVAFGPANVPLARHVGAAGRYYSPVRAAAKIHNAGLYLIGRIVTFEDPLLSAGAPSLAVRRVDGSRWVNNAGLGWTNPYDMRVWRYNVSIAEAAARAGFDEIQFDYVRFPSDGDITQIRYPGRHAQPMGWTIPMFLKYAGKRLRPLGVRVSADVFGLSATRNLGIAQFPRRMARYVDALYPMVYPSHYSPGEFNIVEPDTRPGTTVAYSLRDFRRAVRGRRAALIPWLQDFSLAHRYSLSDIRDEIQAARLEHVKGFMLWNPSGVYTKGALGIPAFR
jgi:hypothetical protein